MAAGIQRTDAASIIRMLNADSQQYEGLGMHRTDAAHKIRELGESFALATIKESLDFGEGIKYANTFPCRCCQ